MTTPLVFTTEEQVAAYLSGLDVAVEAARATLAHEMTMSAQEAFTEAHNHALSERIRLTGVTCEACEGWGVLTRANRHASDGVDEATCGECRGYGKVLPTNGRYA